MTLVCVPIMVRDVASALADAAAAKDLGADLVEFRVDGFLAGDDDDDSDGQRGMEARIEEVRTLCARSPLACIVTCRSAAEGGEFDGDEHVRAALLRAVRGEKLHPARYIDLELEAWERSALLRAAASGEGVAGPADEAGTSLILSVHDFKGRPADLFRRVSRLVETPACAVAKIAYRAWSLHGAIELLDLPREVGKPTIALGMGEFGVVTRVLAPKFGGYLTFASLRPSSATAPGQPTLAELLHTYRFRRIGPATRVFGIIGWPVSQSLSPLVHNAGFEGAGIDAVYVPMPIVAGDDPAAAYAGFRSTLDELIAHPRWDFSGASVTHPHKENLLRMAGERGWGADRVAGIAGAANTLVQRDGAWRVMNTDAHAAGAVLRNVLGQLNGSRISIIGAGGVARSVAAACALDGAGVTLFARDLRKAGRVAAELASRLGRTDAVRAAALSTIGACDADAIVNCTPVGMTGGPPGLPVPGGTIDALSPATVVMDTVYNPQTTTLLARSRARGLRVADGVGMFVAQAASQFEAWTGRHAPAALFERLVRESLSEKPA